MSDSATHTLSNPSPSLPQAKAQLEHDIRAYAYAVEAGDVLAASINISNAIDALIAAVRNESALSRSTPQPEDEKDHHAELAADVNDTGTSQTETAIGSITVNHEDAEDALQHAWNAGVAGAWRCVRDMFAKGDDVQAWALAVEKHSPPVAAEWQQARALMGLAGNQATTEVSSPTAASAAQQSISHSKGR